MHSHFEQAPTLVTGGGGFIGSHLAERLVALGARVTVLDNLQAGNWHNLCKVREWVRTVEADVRDAAAVAKVIEQTRPRFVFHLAANASVPGSVESPAYDFESNCAGTFHILNALRLAGGCEKVILASSGAVYGEPGGFPIREDDPLRPISPYGASKLSAEVQARMFHAVYGVPVVIARLFNTYGPRMARFVVLDFLRKLRSDPTRLEVLGTGKQVRDFTYVSDTVEGLLVLAAHGEDGQAYNLSSGANCSVTELAHSLIAALGLTGKTEIAYTGKSWVGDAQRWEVSIEKIRALGYRPCVPLCEGLARTIDWFAGSNQGTKPSARP
ncbi:MAG TPA: SDR family NAD(P)-dependent oxidoreductase [Chthonomonadaceae bacterium]|nr:SDR family NAD(P)-dependent oxidoreductase [Chthonomonadaceae bacterium]